jgi:DNA adenine methylase
MNSQILTVENILKIKFSSRMTIASYPGGKSGKKHLPLYSVIPTRIDMLIEPFSGLANFYFTISSRVRLAWLNDKDKDVYSLLKCIQKPFLLTKLIDWVQRINPIDRDDYYHWKRKKPTDIVERAVRLLIILNCSPNGAGGGYSKEKAHRKWYENKPKIWSYHSHLLQKTSISNLDYKKVLKEISKKDGKNIFIYLDPPYFKVAKKGHLYRNHNTINWQEFKKILGSFECHWLVSTRDCPEMQELFLEFYIHSYNTYNDMNNTKNGNPELLVSNKPLLRNY